ncbi:Beta-glucosidase 13 [Forsythia ovata]|uniref:Beta-glucosidase 13 n=1 Tax=Forsythia ovata TaxID=205694 RepID=A0ABD1TN77_9LAMI
MNEPYIFILGGYDLGIMAPGRCSSWMNNDCPGGNSAIEPYIAGHLMLLCHAQTVKLYREKYKPYQKGQIGIVLISHWFVPYSKRQADVKAAQRALDFMYGYMHALPAVNTVNTSILTDSKANLTSERNGKFIGNPTGFSMFYVYPRGLKNLLVYTKQKYKNPTIYITECGISYTNITTIKQGTNDPQRVDFYRRHLLAVKHAITDGVDVKGFFPWSLLDTYEWASGYTQNFGLIYVDRADKLKRYFKKSALWFKKFLQ